MRFMCYYIIIKQRKNRGGKNFMSFKNGILKILGFETDETEKNSKQMEKYVQRNWEEEDVFEEQEIVKEKKLVNLTPKNQLEVQSAIDLLKKGNVIILNFEYFSSADLLRAMDFVSGACYCLNVIIKRLDEKVFKLERK